MENNNDGFTVEKGIKYLKCCGIIDECAREYFESIGSKIEEDDYKYMEDAFSLLCICEVREAVDKLYEWCLKDNSVYWNEFLRNEGKD